MNHMDCHHTTDTMAGSIGGAIPACGQIHAPGEGRAIAYQPQLDGVRTIAIGFVLLAHLAPSWERLLPGGNVGVRIFFVLSGYLITGILLSARRESGSGRNAPLFSARQFYARRILRIFPVYYLTIAIAYLFSLGPKDGWPWLLSYSSNWYMALHNKGMGSVSPFWSVAVEEQFYLLWPWIVLFVPSRRLMWVFVGVIFTGITLRVIGPFVGISWMFLYVSTPAAFDALGLGALLAWTNANSSIGGRRLFQILTSTGLYVGLPLVTAFYLIRIFSKGSSYSIQIYEIAAALASVWLVGRAAEGMPGLLGRFLSWKPIVYLGKISYGIYVYHMLIYGAMALLLEHLKIPWKSYPVSRLTVQIVLSILIPAISWHLMEKPINDLKRYFPYHRR